MGLTNDAFFLSKKTPPDSCYAITKSSFGKYIILTRYIPKMTIQCHVAFYLIPT